MVLWCIYRVFSVHCASALALCRAASSCLDMRIAAEPLWCSRVSHCCSTSLVEGHRSVDLRLGVSLSGHISCAVVAHRCVCRGRSCTGTEASFDPRFCALLLFDPVRCCGCVGVFAPAICRVCEGIFPHGSLVPLSRSVAIVCSPALCWPLLVFVFIKAQSACATAFVNVCVVAVVLCRQWSISPISLAPSVVSLGDARRAAYL
jgi:hypothetical protein